MGFRMRKSIKLGPGVRLNVGKRGVGVSGGVRGARYSVHSSGRRTTSVGVPGTGVGYVSSKGGGRRKSSGRQVERPAPVSAPPSLPKPGMFAPKHEKEFVKGRDAFVAGDHEKALQHFRQAAEKDTGGKAIGDEFFTGLLFVQTEKTEQAIPYLEKVVASEIALPDAMMEKYLPAMAIAVKVTDDVTADVPLGSLAAALTLVECYQETGRIEEAIGLLQQLVEEDDEPALLLSLFELLAETGAWDEIADAAGGVENTDDVTLQIKLFHARALRELGLNDAALEVYKEALKSKKRQPELLREARYERGKLLVDTGKQARGMKDLEAVYAEDPGFRDVRLLVRGGDGSAPSSVS